jgi:hypothetical protein
MVASAELENGEPIIARDVALELVEGEHGLVGLALVVLTVSSILRRRRRPCVDLLDGQLDGLLVLAAERRVVAGQRDDLADLDRLGRGAAALAESSPQAAVEVKETWRREGQRRRTSTSAAAGGCGWPAFGQ